MRENELITGVSGGIGLELTKIHTSQRDDLVIWDLCYYSFPALSNISFKGAFYISRINSKNDVYEMKRHKLTSKKLEMVNMKKW
jgi:hypothetical protein